ncbi:MBL fold metallo-hydrolase [Paracoccus alkanivorans]|uniref:MBL fold metallo-hydrolase n=1 Tax=Paracoccus alkanivorans TaxID=2116655 RepID=A0A3M0MQY6_9RHOB|nr:MBL fold metallo-hydrolase [Paracoccus alkanivorans]RMC33727.1 MBL fold metallo-hydrolase [Paracoccus alkanivorans]
MSRATKELRCILAPNPSPLTGPGTNSFLIGQDHVAVIDPGPDDPGHLEAIVQAGAGRISHIFVTHAHRDHSAGASALAAMTGAPVMAFGDAEAGRSPVMQRLAASGLVGGGEGLDTGFQPDILLTDGQEIVTPDWTLRALHTPGHCGNHLCFQWDDIMFCGDIVLGWSSTLISPPDGDLSDYFRSLDRIGIAAPRRLLPAHGDPVEAPSARLAELAAHRRQRTAQIIESLRQAPADAATLAGRIYDVAPELLPAATRNVLAHLVALASLGAVICEGEPTADSVFRAV